MGLTDCLYGKYRHLLSVADTDQACGIIHFVESCRQIEEGSFTRSNAHANAGSSSSSGKDSNGSASKQGQSSSGEILMLCERSLYVLKVTLTRRILP